MEQNPINNALITFDMAKNILRKHISDEAQIEHLYNLVNKSETAFRLAVGLIQRTNISFSDLSANFKQQSQQFDFNHDTKNKEILTIIVIFLLYNKLLNSIDTSVSALEKNILSLMAYFGYESVPKVLIEESIQADNALINEALESAVENYLIYWDDKTHSYIMDDKLQTAYWMINKIFEKQFPKYLINLLKFYSTKIGEELINKNKQDIDNIIKYADSTITKIQATGFQFTKEFLLGFVDLVDKIGTYEMEVKKDGERALQYFELGLKNLTSYQGEAHDDLDLFQIRIFAKTITAKIIVAQSYLSHNPLLAIEEYQTMAPIVENFYKDEPFEIAKFLFNQAAAYGMVGQLHKQSEICQRIYQLIEPFPSNVNLIYINYTYNFAKMFFVLNEYVKAFQLVSYALDAVDGNDKQNHSNSSLTILKELYELKETCQQRINNSKISTQSQNFFSKEQQTSKSKSELTTYDERSFLVSPNLPKNKKSACCCIS